MTEELIGVVDWYIRECGLMVRFIDWTTTSDLPPKMLPGDWDEQYAMFAEQEAKNAEATDQSAT